MTDLQSPCAVVDDEVLGYVARERVLLSKDHVDLGGGGGQQVGNNGRIIQSDFGCICALQQWGKEGKWACGVNHATPTAASETATKNAPANKVFCIVTRALAPAYALT